jgi:hypothetical protein
MRESESTYRIYVIWVCLCMIIWSLLTRYISWSFLSFQYLLQNGKLESPCLANVVSLIPLIMIFGSTLQKMQISINQLYLLFLSLFGNMHVLDSDHWSKINSLWLWYNNTCICIENYSIVKIPNMNFPINSFNFIFWVCLEWLIWTYLLT